MAIRSQAAKDHVSYKVSDRNKTRAYLKCSGDDCPAYARISFHKKTEQYCISQVQDQHSCQGSLKKSRGSQREHTFLVKQLHEGMTVNSKTPIKDVQQFLKRKLGVDIPYTTAHKAKEAVCAETINVQREQYNLVEGYVQCLLREDPDLHRSLITKKRGITQNRGDDLS